MNFYPMFRGANMIDKLLKNKTLLAFFLIGFICAMVLCASRMTIEVRNKNVAAVISDADLAFLAAAEGMDKAEYEKILLDAGLAGTITPGEVNTDLNLWISYGRKYEGEDAVVGFVEDVKQNRFVPIEGFETGDADVVRVFYLISNYAERYASLGYDRAQEIENMFYRAVTERNIRVLCFAPFVDSATEEIITDPYEYAEVLENLSERISEHGLILGDSFSVIEDYEPPVALVIGVFWCVFMAGLLLLMGFFRPLKRISPLILIACLLPCVVLYYLKPLLSIQVFSLAAAVVFPCLAMWHLTDKLISTSHKGLFNSMKTYTGILLSAAGISVLGGLLIGAMQSSSEYMLAINNFRGVKLSQIAPVAFAVYLVFHRFYGGKGIKGVFSQIVPDRKIVFIAAVVLLICAFILFILRTGNGTVPAGVTEQRFRNFLEHALIARPRTKEILVAWPCLAVTFVLIIREERAYIWPFAVLSVVGLSSIVNTFCHSKAPLWLSFTRSVLGLVIGLAIGLVILCIAYPVSKRKSRPE